MLYQLSYVRTSAGPTRSYLRRASTLGANPDGVQCPRSRAAGSRCAEGSCRPVGRGFGARGARTALALRPRASRARRARAVGSAVRPCDRIGGGDGARVPAGPEGRPVGSDAAPTDRDAGHIQKWREHPLGACKLLQVRSRERTSPQGDWRSGSALPSHGRGHWFDPSIAHGRILGSLSCGRSSVGRASPCQGEGRRFESGRPLRGNGAPDLASGALFRMMREHHPVGWPRGEATACKAVYTGSNPVPTSNGTLGCRPGRLAQR